jgi:methanogenic corrinoid protein MtbC1
MHTFGNQLKKIRKDRNLKQKDLAQILDVAQSTIANYEQGIRFPDEDMLLRIADIFGVSVDYLLGRSSSEDTGKYTESALPEYASPAPDPAVERFINLVLQLKTYEAEAMVTRMLHNKHDIVQLYINILQPALYEIGRRWESGEVNVSEEHFFSELVQNIMARAMNKLNGTHEGPVFIGFSVSGELHDIGIRMVSDILSIHGWKSLYLGNNLPTSSVLKAIRDYRADVVGISVSLPYHVNPTASLIQVIRNASVPKPVNIAVGGRVFNLQPDLWKKLGADLYAQNAEQFLEVLQAEFSGNY